MNKLDIFTKDRFKLLGITKQGHALTSDINNITVLIKKRDYNILLCNKTIEGAIVEYNGINMLKTLQF